MQIVRTIVWVLLLVALLLFSAFNWRPVEVKIWEGLILETKIPALVIISFLLGLMPMWMLHKAQRFHFTRRISSLESAARSAATTPVVSSDVPATDEAAVAATPAEPAPEAPPAEDAPEALKPEER